MAARKGCIPAGQAKAFRLGDLGMKVVNVSLKLQQKVFLCTSMYAKSLPLNAALDAGAALFFGRGLTADL